MKALNLAFCLSLLAPGSLLTGHLVDPQAGFAAPPSEDQLGDRIAALEALVQSHGDEALRQYVRSELSANLREALSEKELIELVGELRGRCMNFGAIMIHPYEDQLGVRVVFETQRGWFEVRLDLEPGPPHLVGDLSCEPTKAPERLQLEPFAWDTLDEQLGALEESGLRAALLVQRDGELVAEKYFGHKAGPDSPPIDADTSFAVGSMPIDFTRASILKLVDLKEIRLTDTLETYFEDVPQDKRTITLEQLMTGRSGLRNFHGIRSLDYDMDLAWIDRGTALERIFAEPLLFSPGRGVSHSHSAFGVLAAVVEVASGSSFGDFVREHFLKPAGMTRTGLYQDTEPFRSDLVRGTPELLHGKPNFPSHWGPTSWLVMGSGGMVSNPRDLMRFVDALHAGTLLSSGASQRLLVNQLLEGNNDRGFYCAYNPDAKTRFFLCVASHSPDQSEDVTPALIEALWVLIQSDQQGQ